MLSSKLHAAFAVSLFVAGSAALTWACPFCAPPQPTFTEEIDQAEVAVIAQLVDVAGVSGSGSSSGLKKSKFKIVEILKGEKYLAETPAVEMVYFGEGKENRKFLMVGVDPPKLQWATPTLLTDQSEAYIKTAISLPKTGPQRLAFFQNYLESPDEMIARDAYDEFAKSPYEVVVSTKDLINREQLLEWISNPDVPASRRRLYFTLLGVCGTKADGDLLEKMIRSDDPKSKSGLDSLIACYLRLKGAEGLPLIEDLYLKNKDCEYADTYSAIMALRFHGQDTDVIPRERVTKSMHLMLDRPELADLVIVDLSRWEDWSVMDRLVSLFKNADEKSNWVRVPVVRYLMSCPLPEAKKHLEELEKVDPGAIKRAKTFFFDGGSPTEKATSSLDEPLKQSLAVNVARDQMAAPLLPAFISNAALGKTSLDSPAMNNFPFFTVGGSVLAILALLGGLSAIRRQLRYHAHR